MASKKKPILRRCRSCSERVGETVKYPVDQFDRFPKSQAQWDAVWFVRKYAQDCLSCGGTVTPYWK